MIATTRTYSTNIYNNSSTLKIMEIVSLCRDWNPYVKANLGWVPQHIWIAPRHYYSILAVYMALLSLFTCFLNGSVVIATIKNKVYLIFKLLLISVSKFWLFL